MEKKIATNKYLNFLLEEKKLMNNEKLEIIRTNKQLLGFLIPFIGLALSQSSNTPEVFVLVPFLIVAYGHFLIANLNTLNVVYGYIEALENRLIEESKLQFPFYQMSLGKWMTDWNFNITKAEGFTINPHYLVGFSFALVMITAYIYCVYNGYNFIEDSGHHKTAIIFMGLTCIMLLVLIVTGLSYAIRYRKIKIYAKKHAI